MKLINDFCLYKHQYVCIIRVIYFLQCHLQVNSFCCTHFLCELLLQNTYWCSL